MCIKEIISSIEVENLQFGNKSANNPSRNYANNLNQYLFTDSVQVTDSHKKVSQHC
jgi:hypothetical protein